MDATAYIVNGRKVSREEFLAGSPPFEEALASHEPPGGTRSANWPLESDALGVHPSQRKEAYEESVSVGVPTYYNERGQAVLESPAHRKRLCRALGIHDRNGGYGDP